MKYTQVEDTTFIIRSPLKNENKVDLLVQQFTHKVTVPHPTKVLPSLPVVVESRLTLITTTEGKVSCPPIFVRRTRQP